MSIVQALVCLALALALANAVVLNSSSQWVLEETFSFNECVSVCCWAKRLLASK